MTCFRDSPTKRVADLDFTHPITITEGPAPWRGAQVIATAPLLASGIRAFVRIDVDGAQRYAYVIDQGAAPRRSVIWATGLLFEVEGTRSSTVPDRLHTPSHPVRVDALARRDDISNPASLWSVLVEDGRDASTSSRITVLDGVGDVPSGLLLLGEARLASRLQAEGSVRTPVDVCGDLPRRVRAQIPRSLTLERTA